jgi:amphi-Trp domain-containing protein
MKKNEITIKSKMETDAVATLLSDLVKSFKEGKVVVQKGNTFVTLNPSGQIEMNLEAAEKKGKQKIEISLNWKESLEIEQPEEKILISGQEPVVAESPADEASPENGPVV